MSDPVSGNTVTSCAVNVTVADCLVCKPNPTTSGATTDSSGNRGLRDMGDTTAATSIASGVQGTTAAGLRSRSLNGWKPCGPIHCVRDRSTCEIDNATDVHYCQCLDGYDGVECRPVDECSTTFPCPGGSKCVDMDPPLRYKCACESGYTPVLPSATSFDELGIVPIEYRPIQCLDRVECDEVSFPCHANATCVNTIGGFECMCFGGLVGNGITHCGEPEPVVVATTDPPPPGYPLPPTSCITNEACFGANMECIDSECVCFPGYARVGPNCQNEVHCNQGGSNNDCHARATCTEEDGFPGFSCKCVEGWEDKFEGANGKSCSKIIMSPAETEVPPEPITETALPEGVGPHPDRPTVVIPPVCLANDAYCGDGGTCCSGNCS